MSKKQISKIPYVDCACEIGERVQWKNIAGQHYEGTIKEWDDNVAVIILDDNTEKRVDC